MGYSAGVAVALALAFAAPVSGAGEGVSIPSAGRALSDDEIRTLLIRRSIAGYSGNCPCPYNVTKNGAECGRRSAWSRRGGQGILCYPDDVSDGMIARFRAGSRF